MKNIKIKVSPLAFAGLFIVFFAMPKVYSFALLASLLLHEAGHMTAGTLLGCRMRGITVLPVGISIDMSPASSTCEEIIIASAGPAVNLILCAASALFYSDISAIIMTFSFSVFFINILPIKTLDGGRILYSALSSPIGGAAAMTAVKTTTCVCLSVLWIISVYILFYSSVNFSLLLFCSYMFAYTIVKDGQ